METFEPAIIQCKKCGQRMRIRPSLQDTMLRCPTCKHETLRLGGNSTSSQTHGKNAQTDLSAGDICPGKMEKSSKGKWIVAAIVVALIIIWNRESNDRKRIEEANRTKEEIGLSVLRGVISAAADGSDSGSAIRQEMGLPKQQPRQPSWEEQQRGGTRYYDADGNYTGRSSEGSKPGTDEK